ncbi:30926_t:CDS:2, partial [Racocetra persica]
TNNENSKTPKNNIAVSKPLISSQASTIQNSEVSTLPTSNLPSTHQTSSSNALIAPDNPDPIMIPQRNSSLLENLPFTDRIEVNLLRDLLNETKNSPNILVLDIRSREEFNKGHIKTKNVVCLDPFLLEDGISSVTLELKLINSENCPEHEQKLFSERHTFNLVVYHGHGSELLTKNCATNLIQAIFENEFKKPLKRYPVFLVGGFIAWEQLTGETGVERNNPNIQTNQFSIYDKAGMANFTTHGTHDTPYDSTQNAANQYVKEPSESNFYRPIISSQGRDLFKRAGKIMNFNHNRTPSIILNTLDF